LCDAVQLPEKPDDIREELIRYLKGLPEIRSLSRWQNFSAKAKMMLGRIAAVSQVLCILVMLSAGLVALFIDKDWFTRNLPYSKPLIAMCSGISVFPMTTVWLFHSQGGQIRKGKSNWRFYATTFFILWAFGMPPSIDAPGEWLIVGLVAGILVDIIRRSGRQAQRSQLRVDIENITQKNQELDYLIDRQIEGQPPDVLYCPIMPPEGVKVFVSYTRDSDWCEEMAEELHAELTRQGTECFLDKDAIRPGSHWRTVLNNGLSEANAFVVLVDDTSVHSKWPVAETETALRGKSLNGEPETIILLSKPGTNLGDNPYPIFEALLKRSSSPFVNINQPRIVNVKETTVSMIVSELSPFSYRSTALVPAQLAALIEQSVFLPLALIGGLGGVYSGIVAGLLGYSHIREISIIVEPGIPSWLTIVFPLFAYMAGFITRSDIGYRYELREVSPAHSRFRLIAIAGFSVFFIAWLPTTPLLLMSWSLTLFIIGWFASSHSVHVVGVRKPDSKRTI